MNSREALTTVRCKCGAPRPMATVFTRSKSCRCQKNTLPARLHSLPKAGARREGHETPNQDFLRYGKGHAYGVGPNRSPKDVPFPPVFCEGSTKLFYIRFSQIFSDRLRWRLGLSQDNTPSCSLCRRVRVRCYLQAATMPISLSFPNPASRVVGTASSSS